MYNDESNHSGQGGAFVRRPIPKYNGDKSGGEYQQQDQQQPSPPQRGYSSGGGYRGGGYGRDRQSDGAQSSYSGSAQRGRRPDGGGSGGYGYNRGGGGYGSNDRLVRQNDIIIQLLKDIRDRLPAPPAGVSTASDRSSDSYGSAHSYSSSSHQSSYSGSDGDDGNDFDVSGGAAASEPDGDAGDGDGRFNS